MTGKVYNVIKCEAWIDLQPGKKPTLYVIGQAETSAGNIIPVLEEAVPQGINPQILMLNAVPKQQGDMGTSDVSPRPFSFEKPAEKRQYTSVSIMSEHGDGCSCDVKEVH